MEINPITYFSDEYNGIGAFMPIPDDCERMRQAIDLTEKEKTYLNSCSSRHRINEWITVRYLLLQIAGNKVPFRYNNDGKPLLNNGRYITISHCDRYAAIVFNSSIPAGIDIESAGPRIGKIKERFVRPDEAVFIPSGEKELLYLTLIWSAKEALYKLSEEPCYSFLENMRIFPFLPEKEGSFEGVRLLKNSEEKYTFRYCVFDNTCLVWTFKE
jgi:phosphopantetheinyl transferase